MIDLDGVVRRWDGENDRRAEREGGLPEGAIRRAAFAPELLVPAIRGEVSDEQWRDQVVTRLAQAHPFADTRLAMRIWSAASGAVDPDVISVVRACRRRSKVVLVSNATTRLPADLDRLGIATEFDAVVNSSSVGSIKPQPEIYRSALRAAGAMPEEAVMVDDVAENVDAAIALGMTGHVFRDATGLDRYLQEHGLLRDGVTGPV